MDAPRYDANFGTRFTYLQYLKACETAERIHTGQFRKNSKLPYIVHPIAVASKFESYVLKSIAMLHDVIEDSHGSYTTAHIRDDFMPDISEPVIYLTKIDGQDYLTFILRMSKSNAAMKVKLADLAHNMSDLQEGSLKDKYRLAEYILRKCLGDI